MAKTKPTPHTLPNNADGAPPCFPDHQRANVPGERIRIWRVIPTAAKPSDLTHRGTSAANSAKDCIDDVDCFDW